jgi:hypothetical protein
MFEEVVGNGFILECMKAHCARCLRGCSGCICGACCWGRGLQSRSVDGVDGIVTVIKQGVGKRNDNVSRRPGRHRRGDEVDAFPVAAFACLVIGRRCDAAYCRATYRAIKAHGYGDDDESRRVWGAEVGGWRIAPIEHDFAVG